MASAEDELLKELDFEPTESDLTGMQLQEARYLAECVLGDLTGVIDQAKYYGVPVAAQTLEDTLDLVRRLVKTLE